MMNETEVEVEDYEEVVGDLNYAASIGTGVIGHKCKKTCSLSTTYNGEMTHRKQQK